MVYIHNGYCSCIYCLRSSFLNIVDDQQISTIKSSLSTSIHNSFKHQIFFQIKVYYRSLNLCQSSRSLNFQTLIRYLNNVWVSLQFYQIPIRYSNLFTCVIPSLNYQPTHLACRHCRRQPFHSRGQGSVRVHPCPRSRPYQATALLSLPLALS